LSIVVPVLNEAKTLESSLSALYSSLAPHLDIEVIVCDGGSTDKSLEIAENFPCTIIQSEPGRAIQMNAASAVASGERLLFLHADSRLPANFYASLRNECEWGFFRIKLSGDKMLFRIIERAINIRSSMSKIAGGDQGLFFNRSFFVSINGYKPIPLMEDIAICRMARGLSAPYISPEAIITSSRRWTKNGVIRTILLMWSLRFAYWLGISPARLHKIYYPGRET
jgi:rSAM/selenodomain-associated transferase 2